MNTVIAAITLLLVLAGLGPLPHHAHPLSVIGAPEPRTAEKTNVPTQPTAALDEYNRLVDQFFDAYFELNPTYGTAAGFHQYDTRLEDYSRAGVDKAVGLENDFKARFEKLNAAELPPEIQADRDMILARINGDLLDLENIRSWEKNPDQYSSGISASVFTIMSRKFAPPDVRLRSLIARERQMPGVFDYARHNLKNPPRVYSEVALEQIPGLIDFFRKDVPGAFKEVKDTKLLAEFQEANGAVITALQRYENFLREDLLPVSNGDFRIGPENYAKKVQYDEMVDIPLDRLLEIGYADLRRNQQAFKETAAKLDPQKTAQQVLAELQKDHPAPALLIPTFRTVLGGLRQYIETHHIVTIPSQVPPIVEETPPFMRALTFASMDTPGPYERVAKEAFFNVTLPESTWKPQQVAEFMGGFNRGTIISTAVHEVYPGHYVQFLWVQDAPSKVRKLLGCGTNAEGWAHYTEQMMLDQGYGREPKLPENKDTNFLKIRLGQLQDALLRDARFIAGISMHTGKMSFDQAVDFFVKEGYQPHEVALRETKRGTSDPTYLVYTLGKLEIMKLRDDYQKKLGAKFSLEEFHNRFLQQGFPPIKIIRRTLLGNDSPVL